MLLILVTGSAIFFPLEKQIKKQKKKHFEGKSHEAFCRLQKMDLIV